MLSQACTHAHAHSHTLTQMYRQIRVSHSTSNKGLNIFYFFLYCKYFLIPLHSSWKPHWLLLLTVSSGRCTTISLAIAPILDIHFSLGSFMSTLWFRIARAFSLVHDILSNMGESFSNFTFTKVTKESDSRWKSLVWFFRHTDGRQW